MSQYFPEPKSLGGIVKVELDLSNYATKADTKTEKSVNTSKFTKNMGLTNLKSIMNILDIDKLF